MALVGDRQNLTVVRSAEKLEVEVVAYCHQDLRVVLASAIRTENAADHEDMLSSPMSDLATYGALGSAAASAVAATASWRSALQSRREARESRLPVLHAQIAVMGGRHFITITNSGPGIAKGVTFVVFGKKERCIGVVPWPSGFLKSGQQVCTEMMFKDQLPEVSTGTVSCRDYLEFPRYWTLAAGNASVTVFKEFNWRRFRWEPDASGTIEGRSAKLLEDEIPDPTHLVKVNFGLGDAKVDFEEAAKLQSQT